MVECSTPLVSDHRYARIPTIPRHSLLKQVFELQMSSSAKDVSFMTALISGGTYPTTRTRSDSISFLLQIFELTVP